jgi:AsmA protein
METKSVLRRAAIGLGIVVALVAAGAAVLLATFDANQYKGVAIDWMKTNRNRTLAIDGPIALSVFPRIELRLSKVRLSEAARPDEFLAIDDAGLALELLPLLRKQVVIDRIDARGVRVKLMRSAAGARNIDDLAAPSAPPSAPASTAAPAMGFDISSVRLNDVRLTLRDDAAKIAGDVTLKSLTTGRLGARSDAPVSLDAALALTQPKVVGNLAGKTTLRLDLARNAVALGDMKLAWKGDAFDVRGIDAALEGALNWDGQALTASDLALAFGAALGDLKLAGSSLKVKAFHFDPAQQQLKLDSLKLALAGQQAANPLRLSLDWPQLEAGANALKGSALSGSVSIAGNNALDGTFRSGAPSGSYEQLKVPALALDVSGRAGARSVKARLVSDVTLRPGKGSVAFEGLNLRADVQEPSLQPMAIEARGNLAASATQASATLGGTLNQNRFDITAAATLGGRVPNVKAQAKFDALDLNRLLAPSKPAPTGPSAPETPVALDGLSAIDGHFVFSAGKLAFQQYQVADARLDATLANGLLRIGQLSGRAWGGAIDANGTADSRSNRIAVKLAANSVNVNALLKDVAGKDILEGTGRVDADLTTGGKSIGEFRSRLAGTAALNLRDGAIKGYNLARALRQAKAAISMKQDASAKANQTEKTDFSSLTATARIADGVARSDDLDLRSPFLRIGGAGTFDVGRGRIDYVARTTVTGAAQGQDSGELAALKGVTVPVRLSGPFEAMDWKIEWSGVAAAAVESKLKDKLSERLGVKPADAAASAPKPKDVLKDKLLKGIFK